MRSLVNRKESPERLLAKHARIVEDWIRRYSPENALGAHAERVLSTSSSTALGKSGARGNAAEAVEGVEAEIRRQRRRSSAGIRERPLLDSAAGTQKIESARMGQTHGELRRHRRKIARAVAAGLTIREAAARFQVSEGTIRKACAENNVTPQRRGGRAGGTLTLQILAELINTSKTQEAIAAELDITHQRVGQVAIAARRVGIRLHPHRRLYKARNSAER